MTRMSFSFENRELLRASLSTRWLGLRFTLRRCHRNGSGAAWPTQSDQTLFIGSRVAFASSSAGFNPNVPFGFRQLSPIQRPGDRLNGTLTQSMPRPTVVTRTTPV